MTKLNFGDKYRIMNPWIKGYKVAFIYDSTGHGCAKELDTQLAEAIGRDDVFSSDAPEFAVRLSGTDLSRALPKIYKESDVLIACFNKGDEEHTWVKYELSHALWAIQHACRIILIRERDTEVPEWLKFNLWTFLDSENISEIVHKIKEEVGVDG